MDDDVVMMEWAIPGPSRPSGEDPDDDDSIIDLTEDGEGDVEEIDRPTSPDITEIISEEETLAFREHETLQEILISNNLVQAIEEAEFLDILSKYYKETYAKINLFSQKGLKHLQNLIWNDVFCLTNVYKEIRFVRINGYDEIMRDLLVLYGIIASKLIRKKADLIFQRRNIIILFDHATVNDFYQLQQVLMKVEFDPKNKRHNLLWTPIFKYYLIRDSVFREKLDLVFGYVLFQRLMDMLAYTDDKPNQTMIWLMYNRLNTNRTDIKRNPVILEMMRQKDTQNLQLSCRRVCNCHFTTVKTVNSQPLIPQIEDENAEIRARYAWRTFIIRSSKEYSYGGISDVFNTRKQRQRQSLLILADNYTYESDTVLDNNNNLCNYSFAIIIDDDVKIPIDTIKVKPPLSPLPESSQGTSYAVKERFSIGSVKTEESENSSLSSDDESIKSTYISKSDIDISPRSPLERAVFSDIVIGRTNSLSESGASNCAKDMNAGKSSLSSTPVYTDRPPFCIFNVSSPIQSLPSTSSVCRPSSARLIEPILPPLDRPASYANDILGTNLNPPYTPVDRSESHVLDRLTFRRGIHVSATLNPPSSLPDQPSTSHLVPQHPSLPQPPHIPSPSHSLLSSEPMQVCDLENIEPSIVNNNEYTTMDVESQEVTDLEMQQGNSSVTKQNVILSISNFENNISSENNRDDVIEGVRNVEMSVESVEQTDTVTCHTSKINDVEQQHLNNESAFMESQTMILSTVNDEENISSEKDNRSELIHIQESVDMEIDPTSEVNEMDQQNLNDNYSFIENQNVLSSIINCENNDSSENNRDNLTQSLGDFQEPAEEQIDTIIYPASEVNVEQQNINDMQNYESEPENVCVDSSNEVPSPIAEPITLQDKVDLRECLKSLDTVPSYVPPKNTNTNQQNTCESEIVDSAPLEQNSEPSHTEGSVKIKILKKRLNVATLKAIDSSEKMKQGKSRKRKSNVEIKRATKRQRISESSLSNTSDMSDANEHQEKKKLKYKIKRKNEEKGTHTFEVTPKEFDEEETHKTKKELASIHLGSGVSGSMKRGFSFFPNGELVNDLGQSSRADEPERVYTTAVRRSIQLQNTESANQHSGQKYSTKNVHFKEDKPVSEKTNWQHLKSSRMRRLVGDLQATKIVSCVDNRHQLTTIKKATTKGWGTTMDSSRQRNIYRSLSTLPEIPEVNIVSKVPTIAKRGRPRKGKE